ncbi:MAG: FAD-dependent oxidoreductase, partial [Clostridia bacterium]|nr:FAD-dependent oxidoreductase [Clostridia bacterium]
EFVRYGVMHRNTYINAPKFLNKYFQLKNNNKLFFAGQITGVEGYMESAMSGLVAGLQAYRIFSGQAPLEFTNDTMTGALCQHISTEFGEYSPMNSNFGILQPLDVLIKDKSQRKLAYSQRAYAKMQSIVEGI